MDVWGEPPRVSTHTSLPNKTGHVQSEGNEANSVLARCPIPASPVLLAGRAETFPIKSASVQSGKRSGQNPTHGKLTKSHTHTHATRWSLSDDAGEDRERSACPA